MAHTDKTKPLDVRIWHQALERVAVHDHRNGICDLPTTLAAFLAQPGGGGACTWDFLETGIGVCPCGSCTGGYWHGADTRSERQRVRHSLRVQLKQWYGTGDVDDA